MKTRCIYLLVPTIIIFAGCEPQGDRLGGSTNNVSPPTATNTVTQINRPPESVTTNSAATNTVPRP